MSLVIHNVGVKRFNFSNGLFLVFTRSNPEDVPCPVCMRLHIFKVSRTLGSIRELTAIIRCQINVVCEGEGLGCNYPNLPMKETGILFPP